MRAGFFLSLSIVILMFVAAPAMAQTQVTFPKDSAPNPPERCQICKPPGPFAPTPLPTDVDA